MHTPSQRDRRQLLAGALGIAAAAALAACAAAGGAERARRERKRVLVLGGTRFIGPPIVEALLARGHELELFNRGKTNPWLFPQCKRLVGDRDGDLEALSHGTWDAVIDTWTDLPRHVESASALLGERTGQYVFVSSLNAVADLSQRALDERAATTPLLAADPNDPAPEHFGGRKARCEQILEQNMPLRHAVVRPGLIVGPRDGSDRFTYWPVRIARGGEVLAPGDGRDLTQFIDARDLGEFIATLVERRSFGLFHAVGPSGGMSMRELLEGCRAALRSDARLTWVATDFLIERGVAPWTDLPAWLPNREPGEAFWTLDVSKALAAGLRLRPLAETVRATMEWWDSLSEQRRATLKRGLAPQREAELLADWRRRA